MFGSNWIILKASRVLPPQSGLEELKAQEHTSWKGWLQLNIPLQHKNNFPCESRNYKVPEFRAKQSVAAGVNFTRLRVKSARSHASVYECSLSGAKVAKMATTKNLTLSHLNQHCHMCAPIPNNTIVLREKRKCNMCVWQCSLPSHW